MPDFWEFPTVSMGLGPIMAIYQARFNRYLEDRGLRKPSDSKVWAFLGDGETDEPEALGAITLAARERLDNLIFVINCNLQRLDGPVRGNGNIIQELEADLSRRGLERHQGDLGKRLGPTCSPRIATACSWSADGRNRGRRIAEIQRRVGCVQSQQFLRPRIRDCLRWSNHLSDEQIRKLRLGGHDPEKVYAAYKAAVEHKGSPTVILARTIKGYGLGEAGEGKNITHQQKKLNEEELREFRSRFGIPDLRRGDRRGAVLQAPG